MTHPSPILDRTGLAANPGNAAGAARRVYVVMGVAGCGKTTIGAKLARRRNWPFHEGDDFHPEANVAKMSAGIALSNEDREPWIAAICAALNRQDGPVQVLSCSSLSRAVRDWLRAGFDGEVVFVWLKLTPAIVRRRLAGRKGHFFKEDLLESQFSALEAPGASEDVITVRGDVPKSAIIRTLAEDLP